MTRGLQEELDIVETYSAQALSFTPLLEPLGFWKSLIFI